MANTNIDSQILALKHEYWDSMISKNPEVATRLTADESIIVGAQGVGKVSKQGIGVLLASRTWRLKGYAFSNVGVSTPDEQSAIIAYSVTEELEVEGKPLTLEANDSSVWVRRGNNWVCVLHTETPKGDPFGRDRVH